MTDRRGNTDNADTTGAGLEPVASSEETLAGASSEETLAGATWEKTLVDLRGQMERATFDRLLAGSWVVAWDATTNAWTIGVRAEDAAVWLEQRLAPVVRRG